MNEDTTNIVLDHLEHISQKVDSIEEKIWQLTLRVSSLEQTTSDLVERIEKPSLQSTDESIVARWNPIKKRLELPE